MISTNAPKQSPLLRHFDYEQLDQGCSCEVCAEWRRRRATYQAAEQLCIGHGKSCMCPDCQAMRKVRTAYHAADEKRNLYSEMSFHAGVKHLRDGERVMQWVREEIMSGRRTDGWWEGRAPYYPLAYWFRQAEKGISTLIAAVSGSFAAIASGAATLAAAATGSPEIAMAMAGQTSVIYERNHHQPRPGERFMSLIDHAREEEKVLLGKLSAVRKFIAEYGGQAVEVVTSAVSPKRAAKQAGAKTADASPREEILAKAELYLRNFGRAAFAKDILPEIEKAGVSLGKGGARYLGNLLSRAKERFSYSKEAGFSPKG